jgi:hypothetical protein
MMNHIYDGGPVRLCPLVKDIIAIWVCVSVLYDVHTRKWPRMCPVIMGHMAVLHRRDHWSRIYSCCSLHQPCTTR